MKYKNLLSNPPFLRITIANALGRFGDSLDMLLFSWLIYEITNEVSWSAIMVAFNMLPSILLQPIAGVLIENKEKKKIMYCSDLCRSLCVLVLFFLFFYKMLNPYALLLITTLISSVEAFRMPAGVAIIPKVLNEVSLNYGMSFSEGMTQCFELIGTGIGGIAIAFLGTKITILIDICIFLISAIILMRTKIPRDKNMSNINNSSCFLINFKEALSYFSKKKIMWFLCLLGLILNMVMTPISTLQTPYIVECLHMGPLMLSVIGVLSSISMIFGIFIYPILSKILSNRLVIFIGGMMCSINYLLWAGTSFFQNSFINVSFTVFGTFIGMIGLSIISNSIKIIFVKEIDNSFLARMSGLFNSIISLGSPLLAVGISVIVVKLDIIVVLFTFFVVFFIIFLFIYVFQTFRINSDKRKLNNFLKGGDGND